MLFGVILSPKSVHDLEAIVRYISSDSPVAARKIGQALLTEVKLLGKFPEAGRVVPEFGNEAIREIIRNPYRIIYRINSKKKTVEVSRFWHASRGFPAI